jgi:hypothetical protein
LRCEHDGFFEAGGRHAGRLLFGESGRW